MASGLQQLIKPRHLVSSPPVVGSSLQVDGGSAQRSMSELLLKIGNIDPGVQGRG